MRIKAFSKKLLIADYIVSLLLIAGFFICVALNGTYTKEICNTMINSGMEVSYSSIPQLCSLDGFMDRFCGSLILTGGLSQVQTAVEEVVRFFGEELGFRTCEVHKN